MEKCDGRKAWYSCHKSFNNADLSCSEEGRSVVVSRSVVSLGVVSRGVVSLGVVVVLPRGVVPRGVLSECLAWITALRQYRGRITSLAVEKQ